MEMPLNVLGQGMRGGVPPVRFLGHRFQREPIQVPTQSSPQASDIRATLGRDLGRRFSRNPVQACAGRLRIFLTDDASDVLRPSLPESLGIEGEYPGQQFVQDHAQRIDISSRVNALGGRFGLLGTHVLRRPDKLALLGIQGPLRQGLGQGLGNAKVDDLGDRPVLRERHQDVRGLEVPMDDPLVMRVLHRVADLQEQIQPLLDGQLVPIAVLGDGYARHEFHDEIGPAPLGSPGVMDAGDVRMIEKRQRLPLRLEGS